MKTQKKGREDGDEGIRKSFQSFDLERSSIEIDKQIIRERRISPWQNKMMATKAYKTYRKSSPHIEKTQKSEQFLQKIYSSKAKASQLIKNKKFNSFIQPQPILSQNKDEKEDQFYSSFVYLPIKPVRMATQSEKKGIPNLTLTSFKNKLINANQGKSIPTHTVDAQFNETMRSSKGPAPKISKDFPNSTFRRNLKKKDRCKTLPTDRPEEVKKFTMKEVYALVGADPTAKTQNLKGKLTGKHQSKGNLKKHNIEWCIPRSQKKLRFKRGSSKICKTVNL